jgi:hypothetical protein
MQSSWSIAGHCLEATSYNPALFVNLCDDSRAPPFTGPKTPSSAKARCCKAVGQSGGSQGNTRLSNEATAILPTRLHGLPQVCGRCESASHLGTITRSFFYMADASAGPGSSALGVGIWRAPSWTRWLGRVPRPQGARAVSVDGREPAAPCPKPGATSRATPPKKLCGIPFACKAHARQALSTFAQNLQAMFLGTSTVRAKLRYGKQERQRYGGKYS